VLFAGFFLEEYVLLEQGVLAERLIGVPWLIIVTELVCPGLYFAFRRSLRQGRSVQAATSPRSTY